jgi:dienelactone hydrolase
MVAVARSIRGPASAGTRRWTSHGRELSDLGGSSPVREPSPGREPARVRERSRVVCWWWITLELLVGTLATVIGLGLGWPRLAKAGLDARVVVDVVAVLAGGALIVAGLLDLARGRRRVQAAVRLVPVVVLVLLAGWTLVPAVAVTNVPPIALGDDTPAAHGLEALDVTYRSADGVRLAAWYVPSRNGAAVVLRHGAGSTRTAVLDHAAVLSSHGYGVLLTDARGHGESEGRAMDLGWHGDADITAAVTFLAGRDEVDPERIAVVGLSMGGEEAIGAAAADDRIAAVVAEGATGRAAEDNVWLSEEYGLAGWLQRGLDVVRFAATDLLTPASPPRSLADAVRETAPRPVLVIAAGDVPDEQHVATRLERAAAASVSTWTVDGAGHTGGLGVAPAAWERRVTGFLDRVLEG